MCDWPRLEQCKFCMYEIGCVQNISEDTEVPKYKYIWDCDMGKDMFNIEYCDEFIERQ